MSVQVEKEITAIINLETLSKEYEAAQNIEDPFEVTLLEELARSVGEARTQAEFGTLYSVLQPDQFEGTRAFKALPSEAQTIIKKLSLLKDSGEQLENILAPNVTEIEGRYGSIACERANAIYSQQRLSSYVTFVIEGTDICFDLHGYSDYAKSILVNIWLGIESQMMDEIQGSVEEYFV